MQHVKIECRYCQPETSPATTPQTPRDWQAHPAWVTGLEALNAYGEWVSSMVLPIAFQWIEEHKSEVYAEIPDALRDDVGVVIGAAFKVLQQQPDFKLSQERNALYLAAQSNGTLNTATLNPLWSGITAKVRQSTQAILAEQAGLLEPSAE